MVGSMPRWLSWVSPALACASLLQPLAAGAQPVTAQPRPSDEPAAASTPHAQPGAGAGPTAGQSDKIPSFEIAAPAVAEKRQESRHTVNVDGRPIAYVATAGTLTLRDDDGKPIASMFYVAYTVPAGGGGRRGGEASARQRPVTFFYNGGPGSSTVWLHMGSLGPMRVRTDSPQATRNAPFDLQPNPYSLIDRTDLVFLDAIGSGFSRPLGETKLSEFWGTDPDIDAFARGIERYLTINDRWNSPKVIFGESYGTTRSAGLSYRLQRDGVQLNGVILLSSILNYGRRDPGFDQELINYLPSYAAAAAYHNRLARPPGDLPSYLAEVRSWARGPYALALARADDLPAAEKTAIAAQMAAYTGLSPRFVLDNDLRVDPSRFRKQLLRDQGLTLGRYDDRFTGRDVDAGGQAPEYDPSDAGITGAFVAAFHSWLTGGLGWRTDMGYRPTYYAPAKADAPRLEWDFRHHAPGGGGFGGPSAVNEADVALDLSAAMRQNPHLIVYSLNGIYDLATPFFGTEYDLAHMQIPPELKANLRFAYYPSGHMVYLDEASLRKLKADLARFYDEAAPRS